MQPVAWKQPSFNSFPNNKILDWSKPKAFADDKIINVTENLEFVTGRKENIAGKRRKCWLPAFSSFLTMFSSRFSYRVVKSWDYVVKG